MLTNRSGAQSEQRIKQGTFLLHLSLLPRLPKPDDTDNAAEATQVIQLARASDTSAAVAQMATRFSSGNNELAQLIRSRQDLRAHLDALDKRLLDQFGDQLDLFAAVRDTDLPPGVG